MTGQPGPCAADVSFVEIADINDALLLPWLDLYELSFPADEKVLVSSHLRLLRKRAEGRVDGRLLGVLDAKDVLIGMARYNLHRKCQAAWLWYMAIQEAFRNHGIGSRLYRHIVECCRADDAQAIVIEAQIPEDRPAGEERRLAEARIRFYRRHGAQLLRGIRYIQHAAPGQPGVPMHVLAHSFVAATAQECFATAKSVIRQEIEQVGPLALE